ncbi:MAG TPA: NAD(P)H-dependent oxidoreductase [Stellaceae bacterium]|nr:NAD(P)H-dependent oxidoreductase [Stellaceae bacterium]
MRVLVLFAHPLADSFAAALHRSVVSALREVGHEVDDCDLYATGFDPMMTAAERRAHNTPNPDLSAVEHHVERLRAADAVVLCFPVWWYGMPAILKGYFDRVWVNGVAFHLHTGGKIEPGLHRLKKLWVVCTYGAPWWLIKLVLRDPVRTVIHTGIRGLCTRHVKTRFLALYSMESKTPADTTRFLAKVERAFRRF